MTQNTQGSDVGRIEHPASVVLDWDTMMRVEDTVFGVVAGSKAALSAFEVVSLQDGKTEQGVSLISSLASRFDAELGGECAEVKVLGEPIGVHGRVEVPVILSSPAECADLRISISSGQPGIPRGKAFSAKLKLAKVGVMAALVLWNAQPAAAFFVDREGKETLLATAFAFDLNPVSLCLGNSQIGLLERGSSLPHAGKIENSENCWNPLRADAATAWSAKTSANAKNVSNWAISSRAAEESVEGSTTRAWSPERTVKPHDYATGNGRYSLVCYESSRSDGLNADAITQRPYSGKLEALAKFQVRKPVMQALRNDAVRTYDRAAYAQFYLTKLRVFPTSGTATDSVTLTTNGTMTGTNTVALGVGHIKAIVDTMKERNIPPYVGDDYMAIAWPSTYRTVKNSLETLHQYTAAGIQLIFNAEIGRYENVRFTEQTNISKGITTTGSSGTAWSTSKSDWAFFFGEDTVVEGIAIPEEVRAKIPTDFGRSKGVAYYSINGFGLVHNQTDATQSRVVMWDSAA